MLKKLLIAAGAAVVGSVIYRLLGSRSSKDLVDDACDTVNDIVKEGCRVSVKEKVVDKVQDIKAAGKEIVNAVVNPSIIPERVNELSKRINPDFVMAYKKSQIKFDKFAGISFAVGVSSLVAGFIFLRMGKASEAEYLIIHEKMEV